MFRNISYNGDSEHDQEKGLTLCEVLETDPSSSTRVYAVGDDDEITPAGPVTDEQVIEIPRENIGDLRKNSIVSIGAQRRCSVVADNTSPTEDRRASTWSRRFSLGGSNVAVRKNSVYSTEAGRSSNSSVSSADTGITVLHEEKPPSPIQEMLDAQAPGTYMLTVKEAEVTEEKPIKDEKATVSVSISRLKYADKIATADFLDSYVAKYPLPEIKGSVKLKKIRYGFFTVYRRLFTVVFTANMVALVILASRGMRTTYKQAAIGVGSNILAAVLARHEPLVNAVVSIIHLAKLSWPIAIRKRLGKIYCHAGIHSGCGSSALVWYIYFTVLLGLQSTNGTLNLRIGNYVVTAMLLSCLFAMVGLSHPEFRSRQHDLWELSHRFIGWTITALIWAQVFLLCAMADISLGSALVRSPLFWMVLVVTYLLIYPWAMMRKRTFVATQLSTHALRLEFDYRSSRTGHCIRLAHNPLIENHGFQSIPQPDGKKGFSVIISNAGNWTKNIINSEKRGNKIWVRGRLFLGVIEVPMLFAPLVVVATGSGIAPCLAFLQTHPEWPVRIVWSARFPEVTYGTEIMETILKADPNAIIIDTKETGRPNMPALMYAAYKEIGAEAILCVSTVKVTELVSFEMEARGVPIYVPIFDS